MHLKGILVLIEISFVNHQCKKIAMTQNQLLVYTNENRWLNKKNYCVRTWACCLLHWTRWKKSNNHKPGFVSLQIYRINGFTLCSYNFQCKKRQQCKIAPAKKISK